MATILINGVPRPFHYGGSKRLRLLLADPEIAAINNTKLAELVGCSESLVRSVKSRVKREEELRRYSESD